MLLEVFDDLAAVVDCRFDEVLPGADDDFLLGWHGGPLSGGLLVWNCSLCWTCMQVEWSGRASCAGGLWIVCVGLLLRGRLLWALILCMCWRSSERD